MNLDQILSIVICSGFTVGNLISLISVVSVMIKKIRNATEDSSGLKKACSKVIKSNAELNEKLDTVLKENAQLKAKLKGIPVNEIK